MQRRNLGVLLAVVIVAVVGFVIASGSDDDKESTGGTTTTTATAPTTTPQAKPVEPTKPAPPKIVVKDGKPVGGVKDIEVDKGERVEFSVQSDIADEIHVHGYDLMKDVEAGGTVRFAFKANIDGAFEVELEDRAEQIADLKVNP